MFGGISILSYRMRNRLFSMESFRKTAGDRKYKYQILINLHQTINILAVLLQLLAFRILSSPTENVNMYFISYDNKNYNFLYKIRAFTKSSIQLSNCPARKFLNVN